MTVDQMTCGQGLAANAAIPAKLGELIASMAEILEVHTKALDLGDENAREENGAFLMAEQQLLALLQERLEQDREMLSQMRTAGGGS
jgi:hypothetical protein